MKRIIKIFGYCLLSCIVLACSNEPVQEKTIIRTLDDLNGKTISVLGGSVQDLLASKECPESEILRSDSETDVFMMLETGKACGSVMSNISWKMAKDEYHHIVAYDEPINPMPIAFGFGKDKKELREKFNRFLKEYLATNDLEQLEAEWADPESQRVMPDPDDVSGDNGTLHFAVSAITPPYDFIKNGEISGLEPEILAKFAISLNMKWDFADLLFTGLIPYIQTGRADIGSSIMCITPERQESIDFSDPWSVEGSIILVNENYAPDEMLDHEAEEKTPFFQSVKESFEKSVIREKRYLMILEGLEVTVVISILAALLGTLLGILLCYASMRRNKLVSGVTNAFIGFMNRMPVVVFLMIMFYIVFGRSNISGEAVAIIAFALCFGAYTSLIFRSSVKSIDKGQTEAALSLGFGKVRTFMNVILPQTIQRVLPVYEGEFISLVKETSVVGYIAVFDLTKAGDIIRSRTYEAFFSLILVTILYFLIIWLMTISLKYIEMKTKPSRKKFFK